MPKETVLIVTQPFDFAVDHVLLALEERGVDVVRFDTAWFPRETSLTATFGNDALDNVAKITSTIGKSFDLAQVASIWYRRPRDFAFDEKLDPDAASSAVWTAFGSTIQRRKSPPLTNPSSSPGRRS